MSFLKNLRYFAVLALPVLVCFSSCNDINPEEDPDNPDAGIVEEMPFIKGGDISWASRMNAEGYKFYTAKSKERECSELLKQLGANAIRLRVMVNPEGGWCAKDDVLNQARKAKELGMKIMLAFLYSDEETDADTQKVPAGWEKYTSEQLASAVQTHTRQVLNSFRSAGITLDWIQIGNNVINGMLGSRGKITAEGAGNFARIFKAGAETAKGIYPKAKIVLHPGNGWESSKADDFVRKVSAAGVEYDVLGLSLFPSPWDPVTELYKDWAGNVNTFLSSLSRIHNACGKDIMVCEFGMPQAEPEETRKFYAALNQNTSNKDYFKGIFYKEPESEPFRNSGYYYGAFSGGKPTSALEIFREADTDYNSDPYGISYIYDHNYLPEVHVYVTEREWNDLLLAFDQNKYTKHYVKCRVTYKHGEETSVIENSGLRIRGRASRKRPEGSTGQTHAVNGKPRRIHYGLNFHKFVKDDAHTIHGARDCSLRYNGGDASYVKEVFCYDAFRRAGIFTAVNATHCRLWIGIGTDDKETYMGVYTWTETLDERYLKARDAEFGGDKGNLWKCRYKVTFNIDDNPTYGRSNDDGLEYSFELKSDDNDLEQATMQMKNFIYNYNTLTGNAFKAWVEKHVDVEFLLKTYATTVSLAMRDDYWNNWNNCYVYFNSTSVEDYKFYFIPYDYDQSLGNAKVWGTRDPLNWGKTTQPLIYKLIQFPEYREIYKKALIELFEPQNALLYYTSGTKRTRELLRRIEPYISNDTGSNMRASDNSTSDGYPIFDTGDNNFFKVRAATIHKYCD